MNVYSEEDVRRALTWTRLIPALQAAFREDDANRIQTPERAHFDIPGGSLLAMPAVGSRIGVKIATIFPSRAPSVRSTYILLDAESGERIAVMSANALTQLRTAGASALASSFLSRTDAEILLLIGAGEMAAPLISAHMHVRPIRQVLVWNRTPERARRLVASIQADRDWSGACIEVVSDLETAIAHADIVSAATLSQEPLIRGAWVKPGTHIDLVGAFTPSMRESDAALLGKSSIFVDSREGALAEGGDILAAIRENVISAKDVVASLFDLCSGKHVGRTGQQEITVFKSVGHALEDLVAAGLVVA